MSIILGPSNRSARCTQNPKHRFSRISRIREENYDSVTGEPERFEGLTNWHLHCCEETEELEPEDQELNLR
jgi:hypothetical protein